MTDGTLSPARRIITKFGGLTGLARALGHQHVTTVQGWWMRASIPARRQAEVMRAAKAAGVDLEPADFFDAPADPPRDTHAPQEAA